MPTITRHAPPARAEVPGLWHIDGSLRDVYLKPATLDTWHAFLAFAAGFPTRYAFDGEQQSLPPSESIFANRDGPHLLAITIGPAQVHCHFFIVEEIELDLQPSQIVDEAGHLAVLQFVQRLATATGLRALITGENDEERPLLIYCPRSACWTIEDPMVSA